MRLLLDTHILLWALEESPQLPGQARDMLLDLDHEIFVSSMALWEIVIKSKLGKLSADPSAVLAALPEAGFKQLPFSCEHAAAVGTLPNLHRDPFDRALIAQARHEPMLLLTHDAQVAAYGSMVRLV